MKTRYTCELVINLRKKFLEECLHKIDRLNMTLMQLIKCYKLMDRNAFNSAGRLQY